jgi:hypothetical protein
MAMGAANHVVLSAVKVAHRVVMPVRREEVVTITVEAAIMGTAAEGEADKHIISKHLILYTIPVARRGFFCACYFTPGYTVILPV